LRNFRDGRRKSDIMNERAKDITDAEIARLKAFHERGRTNDDAIMHTIAKNPTELEIQAVALHVSGLIPERKVEEGK